MFEILKDYDEIHCPYCDFAGCPFCEEARLVHFRQWVERVFLTPPAQKPKDKRDLPKGGGLFCSGSAAATSRVRGRRWYSGGPAMRKANRLYHGYNYDT